MSGCSELPYRRCAARTLAVRASALQLLLRRGALSGFTHHTHTPPSSDYRLVEVRRRSHTLDLSAEHHNRLLASFLQLVRLPFEAIGAYV